jgi:ATP-dependent protease ClpP protease subunit
MNKNITKFAPNLLKLFKDEPTQFEVFSSPINSIHLITIDDDFAEVYQFAQLVDTLDYAKEGDIVHIKLSTVGGALYAIVPLINAIQNTDAHVHIHVESDCASAGTILMMLADSVYINDYANIMLHTCQYGYKGHAGNMDAYVKYTTDKVESLMREVYQDFLTEDEIDRMLDGKEIWLDAEECHLRFELRDEARDARIKQLED